MASLTFKERLAVGRMAAARRRRAAASGIVGSRMMRWRFGAPSAERLSILPQELRTADPTFADELFGGYLGLGGRSLALGGKSPFDLPERDAAFAAELNGFGWLRHLRGSASAEARQTAVRLIADWIRRHERGQGLPWRADVAGRRVMSWLYAADFLISDMTDDVYERLLGALADHLITIAATWRLAPDGAPQITALVGLVMGDLCLEGKGRRLGSFGQVLLREIEAQVLPDGGHVSRNPEVPVELLLDLIPLGQCLRTAGEPLAAKLDLPVRRMLRFVRAMRLGDGSLARFNGAGPLGVDAVAMVLPYDPEPDARVALSRASGYARLERGRMVAVVDVGAPPRLALARDAAAGCLSFELSIGPERVLVNAGRPDGAEPETAAQARSTVAHNTAVVAGQPSGELVRNPVLEEMIAGIALRGPREVRIAGVEGEDGSGPAAIEAWHDGYYKATRLIHRRRLEMAADGRRVTGVDRLTGQRGTVRLSRDQPFAIGFNIDPELATSFDPQARTVEIALDGGERWVFSAEGAVLSLEAGVQFAHASGPRQGLKIVLRGATFGETEVRWTLQPVADGPSAIPSTG